MTIEEDSIVDAFRRDPDFPVAFAKHYRELEAKLRLANQKIELLEADIANLHEVIKEHERKAADANERWAKAVGHGGMVLR